MAKIFGVEVKNVKSFSDHEGMGIRKCDVYMDGKKLGSYEEDYMGGCARYDISESDYSALKERANRFYSIYKWYDGEKWRGAECFNNNPDILINTVINLKDMEKDYKRMEKLGAKSVVIIHSPSFSTRDGFGLRGVFPDWKTRFKDTIEQKKARFPKWAKMHVNYFAGRDSFIIDDSTKEFAL